MPRYTSSSDHPRFASSDTGITTIYTDAVILVLPTFNVVPSMAFLGHIDHTIFFFLTFQTCGE